MIEIENVSKKYADKVAVNNVTFSVEKGEIFGLLGPSGAGKTSLIKIITTQIKHDTGHIKVMGKRIEKWKAEDNVKLGIMTEGFGLYDRLTCCENIRFYERIFQLPENTGSKLIEEVGLADAMDKRVSELSKGMRQRLSFVRAIINSPQLLFLDEPTSDLDPISTERIHEIIKMLRKQGTTVFLSTHDMSEATKLCDKIGLLNHGALIEYGDPHILCTGYNSENMITIIDKKGVSRTIENRPENAEMFCEYFKNNNVISIKSSEMNLEQLFIKLTSEKGGTNE